jgi:transposase
MSTKKKPTRWSAKRKMEVVLRLFAGEALEDVSRDIGVETYRIAEWRDQAQEAMAASLKARSDSPEVAALEEEKKLLQGKLGEVVMDNELLRERIAKLEAGAAPLARRRRSRR